MGVGIQVGQIVDEIGTSDFLHAFFSTISFHCEPKGWGTRFPTLMRHLYRGAVSPGNASAALEELRTARTELARVPPARVVWDLQNLTRRPPWGDNISGEITNLSNYFVTSSGRDLFAVLDEALAEAVSQRIQARIV